MGIYFWSEVSNFILLPLIPLSQGHLTLVALLRSTVDPRQNIKLFLVNKERLVKGGGKEHHLINTAVIRGKTKSAGVKI